MRWLQWPGPAPVILVTGTTTVMGGAAIAPGLAEIHTTLAAPDASPMLARLALVLPSIVVMFLAPTITRQTAGIEPRRLVVGALCLVAVFGALAGLSSGYSGFLLSRALLGLAVAAALTAATTAVAHRYEGVARARMMSIQTAMNTLTAVVFILAGGFLASVDWRLACLLYLLVLPVALAAWRLDWGKPLTLGQGGRGSPSPAAFTRWPIAAILTAMAAFYLLPTQVPFVIGTTQGPVAAGLVIGLGTLASAPAAFTSARLAVTIGPRGVMAIGFALIAFGCLEMSLISGVLAGVLAAVLIGTGYGLTIPVATFTAFGNAGPGERRAISGQVASALCGGQVLAMLYATLAQALGGPSAPFWSVAILISAGFLLRGATVLREALN